MKASIEVENRKEGDMIRKGLADPVTRALVKVMGALSGKTVATQGRILRYVKDHFDEAGAGS